MYICIYKYIYIYINIYIAEMQKGKRLILCYSDFCAKALVRQTLTLSDECLRTKLRVTENQSFAFLHFCYIYIYIYIYHVEGAVFTTIWCSMYKVQSVDSRSNLICYIYNAICYIYIYIYIYISHRGCCLHHHMVL